jgi:tetratricopeptide (TPR) repeat protein
MLRFAQDELAVRLAALCEQFYLNRAIEPLTEAAELLASLPGKRAQAAGRYYQALVHIRQGEHEEAVTLLESVASCEATPKFRARAIHSLGVIHRREGDRTEAARLYHQAARLAGKDPVAIIRAGMTLAELHGSEGDHESSLAHLRAIRPAVELAARIAPFYLPGWCNDVAIDLAGLGRLAEARRFAQFAIASPFVRAYPEWLETAQEIEQQAEAKAVLNARPAIEQARSTPIKPKLRLFKKPCLVALTVSTRRRIGPVIIIRPEQPRSRLTLEQISFKVQIRAPSF